MRTGCDPKHGHTMGGYKTPIYKSWQTMLSRCYSPSNHKYRIYGARGIRVCRRWRRSFENFMEDMWPRPAGTSLGRIDNNKGYCKANCRWETAMQQANNTRANRILLFRGKRQTLSQWARELGTTPPRITARLKYGWTLKDALTIPCQQRGTSYFRRRFKEAK